MRLIGIILVLVGIIALAVPSITFYTTEQAVDAGFIQIDFQKPHTLVMNPVVGAVSLIAGLLMVFAGKRTGAV